MDNRDQRDNEQTTSEVAQFCVGDTAQINSGMFENYDVQILSIDHATRIAETSMVLFGNQVPLDLPLALLHKKPEMT